MNNLNKFETSLTKGAFAYKPVKFGKSQDVCSSTQREFQQLWRDIEAKIKVIESSSYQETLEAVLQFVQSYIQFPVDEIPAAVMQMGVNMPDHSNIFKQLDRMLKLNDNYTIILESRKCHNFSNTIQLIDQELRKQLHSKVKASPSKRARFHNQKKLKPIVFLLQDVETFNVELLEEIILNCKIYVGKLPIVLIFGMSSAMVTLHKILPQKVLCFLGIETFQSFAATDYLTHIIQEVLMSPVQPFKLGPKVFRLIVDTVLYHDFSVTNLSLLLRFALMEHFHSSRAASLCCSASKIEKRVNALKNEELQCLKKLPSLKLYQENNPDIVNSLSTPAAFRSLLVQLLHNLFRVQSNQLVSLRVLYELTRDLPGSPLGKQFREIYLLNLEKEICFTKGFKEAEQLLKFQSQKNLLSKFKSCLEISHSHQDCEDLVQIIKNSIEQLSGLTADDFRNNFEKPLNGKEKFASRFELQEKMRSSIKLKRSKFETVRTEIVEGLLEYFKVIHSPLLLPLHEVLFFDDILALKRHLMPSPRLVFCSALSNPHHYFKCQCCRLTQAEEVTGSMPDVCLLYKLHLECEKLINLCDWLEAFRSLKRSEMKSKRGHSKIKRDDSIINIRFFHAASELQLLGFIKPTKRKTDHVARLTFGTF